MVPIVMVEKWLNHLTENTFVGDLEWNNSVGPECVAKGHVVKLSACEGCVEVNVTKCVSSFGLAVHVFHKKIVSGDFLYPKAEELYQLAKASAERKAIECNTVEVQRFDAALTG